MSSSSRCTFLGFPQQCRPVSVVPDASDALFNPCSIISGPRHGRYVASANTTEVVINWDFVTPKAVNYLFISRLDCVVDLTEVEIYYSDDDVVYTSERLISVPSLLGPRKNDLFDCFTNTTLHRYWRIVIRATTPQQFVIGQVYFGQLFDLGIEPSTSIRESHINGNSFEEFRFTAGNVMRKRIEEPVYIYQMEWTGVSNEIARQFYNKVSRRYNRYVIMTNTDFKELFNEAIVLHGFITRPQITRRGSNYNDIQFTFTEMIG